MRCPPDGDPIECLSIDEFKRLMEVNFWGPLRIELAPFGIEVTALEPGGVKTGMTGFDPPEEEACWASVPEDLLPQRAVEAIWRRFFGVRKLE